MPTSIWPAAISAVSTFSSSERIWYYSDEALQDFADLAGLSFSTVIHAGANFTNSVIGGSGLGYVFYHDDGVSAGSSSHRLNQIAIPNLVRPGNLIVNNAYSASGNNSLTLEIGVGAGFARRRWS